ncbi:hypothetical protein B7463_g11861, partial [Scytalidium lignicola]
MTHVDEGLLQGMDEQTGDLILQLQLQDLDVYFSSSKGKAREGEVSDESLAFQMQVQELQRISSLRTDKRMARSIATAEDLARRDRSIASQLNNGVQPPNTEYQEETNVYAFEDELIDQLEFLYVSGPNDLGGGNINRFEAESSQGASRTKDLSSINRRCEACREEVKFYDVAQVPCSHEYCRSCLQDLFEMSMTDESLFPPRCCRQQIPVRSVRVFLKLDIVQSYEKKKIEFETPNRTYCHSSTCSTFINTSYIKGEIATCPVCSLTTCTTCKAEAHKGDCPNDAPLQQVLQTARENGWQRCYSCWRVIELEHGCVGVVPNSATFVESGGRLAPATSGMSIVFLLVRIKFLIGSLNRWQVTTYYKAYNLQ